MWQRRRGQDLGEVLMRLAVHGRTVELELLKSKRTAIRNGIGIIQLATAIVLSWNCAIQHVSDCGCPWSMVGSGKPRNDFRTPLRGDSSSTVRHLTAAPPWLASTGSWTGGNSTLNPSNALGMLDAYKSPRFDNKSSISGQSMLVLKVDHH